MCNQGQEVLAQGNWRNLEEVLTVCVLSVSPPPPPPSVTEALHFQQKLDETTKLLRNLQEAQKERLSAKQPPNMICLLAPTAKELELGKSLSVQGPLCSSTKTVTSSWRPLTTLLLPLKRLSASDKSSQFKQWHWPYSQRCDSWTASFVLTVWVLNVELNHFVLFWEFTSVKLANAVQAYYHLYVSMVNL